MMRSQRTDRAGFSLIEVLVAMAIMGIGIIAVMQLFPSALRQARAATERRAAATLAESELNRMLAITRSENFVTWARLKEIENTLTESDSRYKGLRTNVQCIPGATNVYRVTLSIDMYDGRRETYMTYVTRR